MPRTHACSSRKPSSMVPGTERANGDPTGASGHSIVKGGHLEHLPNLVPAAAVRREVPALSVFIRCRGSVACHTWRRKARVGSDWSDAPCTGGVGMTSVETARATSGEGGSRAPIDGEGRERGERPGLDTLVSPRRKRWPPGAVTRANLNGSGPPR
jgi:hypothetical protein